MNIEDLTIKQARELTNLFGNGVTQDDSHWQIGKIYLIRTVTMINTGILVKVTSQELVLKDATWIADTSRFSDALTSCKFNEVEPFPDDAEVIIGRGSVIDAVQISKTQRSQK